MAKDQEMPEVPTDWDAEKDVNDFSTRFGCHNDFLFHALERIADGQHQLERLIDDWLERFFGAKARLASHVLPTLSQEARIALLEASLLSANAPQRQIALAQRDLGHLRRILAQKDWVLVKCLRLADSVWLAELGNVIDLLLSIRETLAASLSNCLPGFSQTELESKDDHVRLYE